MNDQDIGMIPLEGSGYEKEEGLDNLPEDAEV